MSYTSTGGLPTIPRLAVAGVDEGAPGSASSSGAGSGSSDPLTLTPRATPAAPASGLKLYADATGKLSWIRASDGFTRTFEVTATANRTFTIPNADFTFAGQNLANTFTLANTFQAQTTIPLGSAASPAINFTGTSSGLFSSGSGLVNISVNGTERYSFAASTLTVKNTAGEYSVNSDTIISRKAAANWQLGTSDAAAPVAQTLSVQSVVAGTTDTAGVNNTFDASRGTGTGVGGSHVFRVAPAGSTGSSQNSLVRAMLISPNLGVQFGSGGGGVSPAIWPFSASTPQTVSLGGYGLAIYTYAVASGETGIALTGTAATTTSGTLIHANVVRSFAPTSGTAAYNHLTVTPTINQTGGANGITRGLYINPTLTAAADFRALEISAGNIALPKTVTAGGTTGAQTIDKVTGSVNFAAAATSLVVTNSYVTTSSIIIATVATNDTTMKSVAVVAGSGSFTIHANAAATAETRVNFIVTN